MAGVDVPADCGRIHARSPSIVVRATRYVVVVVIPTIEGVAQAQAVGRPRPAPGTPRRHDHRTASLRPARSGQRPADCFSRQPGPTGAPPSSSRPESWRSDPNSGNRPPPSAPSWPPDLCPSLEGTEQESSLGPPTQPLGSPPPTRPATGSEPRLASLGTELINNALERHAHDLIRRAVPPPDADQEGALQQAVFNLLFGLGRLQPHLERPDVINLHAAGSQPVWLDLLDGTTIRGAPVADSDDELVEFVRELGRRVGLSERLFDPAHPRINLQLPNGCRHP